LRLKIFVRAKIFRNALL